MRQRSEQGLVERFVQQSAVEALVEPVLLRLAGRDERQPTLVSFAHARIALVVYSLPLSLMMVCGGRR